MKAPLLKGRAPCFCAAGFGVLGLVFFFAVVGYQWTGCFCFGVAAVLLLLRFLPKQFGFVLLALLLAGCVFFTVVLIPIVRASRGDHVTDTDYVIVLGAGVRGTVPSLSLENRLSAALAYLNGDPEAIAILSGGMGDGEAVTEARAMYDWLTASGIPPERLLLEERAASTEENLRFSFAMIPDGSSVAIISSEYHLYRAEQIAKAMGYSVRGIPAHTTLPVLRLNYFMREVFGVVYLRTFGV